jgi:Neocarzinostatin family
MMHTTKGEQMRRQVIAIAVVGAALALLGAACGGDDSSSSSATTPTTPATEATTSTTAPPSPYKATVTPSDGLTDGQAVTVAVSGFTAGKTVGINECSDKTDDTGSGCDLAGIKTMTIGADGTATSQFNVKVGPFGTDKVVCTTAGTQCLISVGELVAEANAQRSDPVNIKFAG